MAQIPPVPVNPPTLPDALAAPKRQSTWPTVLGVIAIVFGVLGILTYGVCGIAAQFFGTHFMTMMQTPDAEATIAVMEQYRWLNVGVGLLYAILAVLLLVAGIAMTRRRANSRSLTLVWACMKIVVVVLGSVIGFFAQQAQLEVMTQQQATVPPGMQQMQSVMLFVGIGIGVVWGWALPLFMVIWFNRQAVRDEIADWE